MGAPLSNLPSNLRTANKPIWERWGDFCASELYTYPKIVPPIQRRLKRLTTQQRLGLNFEHAVFSALSRGDFTENLGILIANNSHFQNLPEPREINKNQISKNDYLILHNPNFSFIKNNKPKLCVPDILIFVPNSISYPIDSIETKSVLNSISFSPFKRNLSKRNLPTNHLLLDSISLSNYQFIICIEVKYSYVEIAFEKLKKLYLPIVSQSFNLPTIPLVCVKNLNSISPPSTSILSKSFELEIPLLTYLGSGLIY